MNDTPETDAEHAQFAMGGFTLDFCRKLERERDEARKKIVALGKQINGLNIFANERYEEIQKVRKERDEVREALAEALQSLECAVKDIFEMRQLIKEIRRDLPRV